MDATTSRGSAPSGTSRVAPSGSLNVNIFSYEFEYCGWPLFCSPLSYRLQIPFATGHHFMSPFRFRNEPPYIFAEEEEESSSRTALFIAIGAAAGFAAGVLIAGVFGGLSRLYGHGSESI